MTEETKLVELRLLVTPSEADAIRRLCDLALSVTMAMPEAAEPPREVSGLNWLTSSFSGIAPGSFQAFPKSAIFDTPPAGSGSPLPSLIDENEKGDVTA